MTNGKLYAYNYKKEREKYVKTGCVTKPEDLLAVGIEADYDVLGLTIVYMVEKYDFDEDDKMGESYHQANSVSVKFKNMWPSRQRE